MKTLRIQLAAIAALLSVHAGAASFSWELYSPAFIDILSFSEANNAHSLVFVAIKADNWEANYIDYFLPNGNTPPNKALNPGKEDFILDYWVVENYAEEWTIDPILFETGDISHKLNGADTIDFILLCIFLGAESHGHPGNEYVHLAQFYYSGGNDTGLPPSTAHVNGAPTLIDNSDYLAGENYYFAYWKPVPEPSTGLLALSGLTMLLRRRRRK